MNEDVLEKEQMIEDLEKKLESYKKINEKDNTKEDELRNELETLRSSYETEFESLKKQNNVRNFIFFIFSVIKVFSIKQGKLHSNYKYNFVLKIFFGKFKILMCPNITQKLIKIIFRSLGKPF